MSILLVLRFVILCFISLVKQLIFLGKFQTRIAPIMRNLLYYKSSRRISYETRTGTANFIPNILEIDHTESVYSAKFDCILGMLSLNDGEFLFFVTDSESLGNFDSSEIYRIKRVEYVSISGSDTSEEADAVKSFIEDHGFYFSFEPVEDYFVWNRDLFLKFNDYKKTEPDIDQPIQASTRSPFSTKITMQAKKRFSMSLRRPSITNDTKSHSLTHDPSDKEDFLVGNMFCGYFETQSVRESGEIYFLKILSRISTKKIGARMISRGVNERGDVSFFVETKFTVKSGKNTDNFVILRGSVPIYWLQNDPLKPQKIIFPPEDSVPAFIKHFEKLEKSYGEIVVVDLLGFRKYERILSKTYKDLCHRYNKKYIHFDLNHYASDYELLKDTFCSVLNNFLSEGKVESLRKDKNLKSNANESIKNDSIEENFESSLKNDTNEFMKNETKEFIKNDKIEENFESSLKNNTNESIKNDTKESLEDNYIKNDDDSENSSCEENSSENSCELPKGYLETNTSNTSLEDLNSLPKENNYIFRVNCMDCLDRTNLAQFIIFNYFSKYKFRIIKKMWQNNGNALSNLYTGSDALKGELTCKGKMSVMGKMGDLVISANRMLNNKFTDKDKQRTIDTLLGKKSQ